MTSVSASHIILSPIQPAESRQLARGSNPRPPDQESHALPRDTILLEIISPFIDTIQITLHHSEQDERNDLKVPYLSDTDTDHVGWIVSQSRQTRIVKMYTLVTGQKGLGIFS